jgi:biotin carboxylase
VHALGDGVVSASRPLVVLLTSGYHLYREYLLADVARAADVWLLADAAPTWEQPYLVGHTTVDTLDAAAASVAAGAVAARRGVDGVLCWDEIRMVQAAEVARALGTPGPDPDAVRRCRDKHATRTAMAAAGLPGPWSELVADLDGANAAADRISGPVVLKPRSLGASIGVVRVDDPSAPGVLEAAFDVTRTAREDGGPSPERGVLVEECMVGPEISVDCAVVDGTTVPLFLARKQVGFGVHCEEVGHLVDGADPLLDDPDLRRLLDGAHRAVGYDRGVTHVEVMLTADGPRVVEINARLGGDLIPRVARAAAGVDAGALAVDVACGRAVAPPARRSGVASVTFCYPPHDMAVTEALLDVGLLPDAVVHAALLARPGQELELPPAGHVTSRYGYVIAHGDDADTCAAVTDRALAAFSLRGRPLPPTPPTTPVARRSEIVTAGVPRGAPIPARGD